MKKTTNEELHRPSAEEYARMRKMPVTVVLDNIRSLNNVGSFFRTCDAFAVEQAEGAVMLEDFRPGAGQRYALVFGNEVEGVAQEVADMCDGAVEIPQAGTKHSLNVAVAGGAVLWHLFAGYISEKKAADETV